MEQPKEEEKKTNICYFVFLASAYGGLFDRMCRIIIDTLHINEKATRKVLATEKYDIDKFVFMGEKYKIIFVNDMGLICHPRQFQKKRYELDEKYMQQLYDYINFYMGVGHCSMMFAIDVSEVEYNWMYKIYRVLDNEELTYCLKPLMIDLYKQIIKDYKLK